MVEHRYAVTYSDAYGRFCLGDIFKTREDAEIELERSGWKPCPDTRKKDWYKPNDDDDDRRALLTIESRIVKTTMRECPHCGELPIQEVPKEVIDAILKVKVVKKGEIDGC